MIRVKMMRGNETVVIDNGKSYVFGLDGKCHTEDAGNIGGHMDGSLDLPLISLLTSNSHLEVAVSTPGGELKRYESTLDGMECASMLTMYGGFVKMLRRTGQQDEVRFNQIIFIYREDFDLSTVLNKLSLKRVGGTPFN